MKRMAVMISHTMTVKQLQAIKQTRITHLTTNQNHKHKNKENSGKKDTTPKRKIPDIRSFVNSVTGKRKTLETTPKKNENEKNSNT